MTTTIETVSSADAVHMLREQLGPLRNWSDFLSDNIRGRQSIAGFQLLPVALRRDQHTYRPVYDVAAIRAFIENVRKLVPSAVPTPVRVTALAIDSAKHWRMNKFDRHGAPATMLTHSPTFHVTTAF